MPSDRLHNTAMIATIPVPFSSLLLLLPVALALVPEAAAQDNPDIEKRVDSMIAKRTCTAAHTMKNGRAGGNEMWREH